MLHQTKMNQINYQIKLKQYQKKKGFTKDLINKFSILNGAKYFTSEIFQNYLVFIPAKKYIKSFGGTTRIELRKPNKKVRKKYWKYN